MTPTAPGCNHFIALVGAPNSGKTSLFNKLTGSRQKTANYAGVTVERKEGQILETKLTVIDLPGVYSLQPKSPDESVTVSVLKGTYHGEAKPDVVVAIADATNLERQLYLVTEVRELGMPTLLVLNLWDLAEKSGLVIDIKKLSQKLGLPVIAASSTTGLGIKTIVSEIQKLLSTAQTNAKNSSEIKDKVPASIVDRVLPQKTEFIEARYRFVDNLIADCVTKAGKAKQLSRKIDYFALHPVLGPVILVLLFAIMFQAIFAGAEWPTSQIEAAVGFLHRLVSDALPEGVIKSLMTDGIIAGVGSVVVFLPQILLLFFFIFIFEGSGYLSRAAFILDRIMQRFGLNGRAFVPLLSSFACAVPGIMATRVLDSRRDRILTIMVAPLMTCSARLPVYTILIAAFVPQTEFYGLSVQGLVLFSLYIGAVVVAMLISALLSKTILKGQSSTFILELPDYKMPSMRNIALGLYDRARVFLKKAGSIILVSSIVLWILANYPKGPIIVGATEQAQASVHLEHSLMGQAGKLIEPLVRPLGYDWKIGIGLLASFAAREVFVATMGTVYAVGSAEDEESSNALVTRWRTATHSDTGEPVFTLAAVASLLVFYMLACQCVSTLAITKRETNSWRWPIFMFVYMSIFAYVAAFATYRICSILL